MSPHLPTWTLISLGNHEIEKPSTMDLPLVARRDIHLAILINLRLYKSPLTSCPHPNLLSPSTDLGSQTPKTLTAKPP
jgi:hypothetical protein